MFGLAMAYMTVIIISLVLELITSWKVFEKYGEPGWKGIIPFYRDYIEYGKVWSDKIGIVYIALAVINLVFEMNPQLSENYSVAIISSVVSIVFLVIRIMFSYKKSLAFGHGIGMTLVLIFFPFIANFVLGFGASAYNGVPEGRTTVYRD